MSDDLIYVVKPHEAAFALMRLPELYRGPAITTSNRYSYAFADPTRVRTTLNREFYDTDYDRFAAAIREFTHARAGWAKLPPEG